MDRTVSTALTPFWKFIFPVCMIGFLALFTFAQIAHPERVEGGRSWPSALGTIFGWLIALLVSHKLAQVRRVRVAEEGMFVSNYVHHIRVPWDEIADVTLERVRTSSYVIVTFRRETRLGRQTVFIPKVGREPEVVAELRQRASLAVDGGARSITRAG